MGPDYDKIPRSVNKQTVFTPDFVSRLTPAGHAARGHID